MGGNKGQDQEQGSIKPGAFVMPSSEEQRAEEQQLRSGPSPSISAHSPCLRRASMSANQPASTDPTKMGMGRSIAVLTSGGDAQGEPRSGFWCVTAD